MFFQCSVIISGNILAKLSHEDYTLYRDWSRKAACVPLIGLLVLRKRLLFRIEFDRIIISSIRFDSLSVEVGVSGLTFDNCCQYKYSLMAMI
jgi:hypothetical protein